MAFRFADYGKEATPDEKTRAARDVDLAIKMHNAIVQKYPGHHPKVRVDSWGGIAQVAHPLIPQCWGIIIKLSDLTSDPTLALAHKAFGQCLERFYLRRGKRDEDAWSEASQKYHKIKNGILKEVNWKTGETKFVLPQELAR